VAVPDWIWLVFLFAFGCCIGSFLNVVIYRLPRERSIVSPPSACPACGRHIRWFDNIPLVSWLLLGRKCRYCKAPISPRYFIIELLTGLVFVGIFLLYFRSDLRSGIPAILDGGWLIWLVSAALLAGLIAASAIDVELWVIPLSICWFVTAAGLAASALAGWVIDPAVLHQYFLLPSTADIILRSSTVASLAAGATLGLVISNLLLAAGLVRRSYDLARLKDSAEKAGRAEQLQEFSDRIEVCREIIFLLPIVVCSIGAHWVVSRFSSSFGFWLSFSQKLPVAGLLGALWGYFVGAGLVWATRIFGTLVFGKEAMGLGDVHLMGAAGAVIGPVFVVIAFFIAPFFGLAWAGTQMFFRKTRQIPYGPFLSLGILVGIILHDGFLRYLISILYP